MSLGNSQWNAIAGGGVQQANASQVARFVAQLGIGTAPPNVLLNPGDVSSLRSLLTGTLAEAGAFRMRGGDPCYLMPVNASLAGALGSVGTAGSGNATLSAAAAPHVPFTAKIVAGGALGTMTVQFSVNGGNYGSVYTSSATSPWTMLVLGTFCTVSFATGTYVAGDTWLFGIDGSITHSGTGTTNPTQTSSPVDSYEFLLSVANAGGFGAGSITASPDGGVNANGGGSTMGTYLIPSNGKVILPGTGVVLTFGQHTILFTVTTGGVLGAAIVSYQVDGGATVTGLATTPNSGTSFVFVVPGTGVTVTFAAGTYVSTDTYSISALGVVTHTGTGPTGVTQAWAGVQQNDTFAFLTIGAGHSTTDLNNALTALQLTRNVQLAGVHVVTMPSSAAAAVSAQATLDAAIASAYTNYNLDWDAWCECPHALGRGGQGDIILSGGVAVADTADTTAVVAAARGSDTNRTGLHAGSYRMASALTGWKLARPLGWAAAYQYVRLDPGTDLAAYKNGPLPIYIPSGALTIGHDESVDPGLDNVQINSARTYGGNGVYFSITSGGAGWKKTTTQASWQDARGVRVLDTMTFQLRPEAQSLMGESPPTNADGTIEEFTRRAWSSKLDTIAKRGVGVLPGGPYAARQASNASALVLPSSQLGQSPKQLLINYALQQLGFVSSIQNNVYFSGTLAISQQ